MSYSKAMFHRIAEELDRIADECADLDEADIYTVLDAMGRILVDHDANDLEMGAIGVVTCMNGGMYEVFQELPDCLDFLEVALMKHQGYERLETNDGEVTCWVKHE